MSNPFIIATQALVSTPKEAIRGRERSYRVI
jgi:hypothetical protein